MNFDDTTLEKFGATRLEDLGFEQIIDAYACIMCYRCQDVCPAYQTGKVLSPAALEINKRYFLNQEGGKLAEGEASSQTIAIARAYSGMTEDRRKELIAKVADASGKSVEYYKA